MAEIGGLSQRPFKDIMKDLDRTVAEAQADREAAEIKSLEARGYTGRTSPRLDMLNRRQTDRLSNEQIVEMIRERENRGAPTGKLRAAARLRGLSL